MDGWVVVAGVIVGLAVGMTGMGGGALMTPVLVLVFGVQPLAAVSSDLVASVVMKPVGGFVHLRQHTVHKGLVLWLAAGSVPSAFCGVLLLKSLGAGKSLQTDINYALGGVLVLTAALLAVRALQQQKRVRSGQAADDENAVIRVRKIPTLLIGILGGLVVGATSAGSGSLIIAALTLLYPALTPRRMVGTDLVQAVPLVMSAALAHLLFGHVEFGLTGALLLGTVPGTYVGARISSRAPGGIIRGALAVILIGSGVKLLGASTLVTGLTVAVALVAALAVWRVAVTARTAAAGVADDGPTQLALTTPLGQPGGSAAPGPSAPGDRPAEDAARV